MQPLPAIMSSGDLTADRRLEWARDCEAKGDLPTAADLLLQALELVPHYAPAWFQLGDVYERLDRKEDAIAAYRAARERDPADTHGALLGLIRLGAASMSELPPAYLQGLFDQYAPAFDAALVQGLQYNAPCLLREAIERECARAGRPLRFGSALDLGCGTGLSGEAFRSCADWLVGVDISPGMIAQARKKVIYDRLQAVDLMTFLQEERAANAQHHLLLAADVFVYLADLAPVIGAAATVIAPGGYLAFTVETHAGEGVILRATNRFAHGKDHVHAAIERSGLALIAMDEVSTRTEKRLPVPGLLAVARHA